MWYWHDMGLWGWLMMVGFWVLVVLLVAWAIRYSGRPADRQEVTALQILDERLARGEIERDEYEERRGLLEANRS